MKLWFLYFRVWPILLVASSAYSTAERVDLSSSLPLLVLREDLVIGSESGSEGDGIVFGERCDAAVGPNGQIYVADRSLSSVRVFREDGRLAGEVGRQGEGPGEFDTPRAIDVSREGNIVILGNRHAHLFGPDHKPLRSFSLGAPVPPLDVAIAHDGSVLVTWFDVWKQKVLHRYSQEGQLVESLCDSWGVNQDLDVREETTFAGGYVDVSPISGGIAYAQFYPGEIRMFRSDGTYTATFASLTPGFDMKPVYERRGDSIVTAFLTRATGVVYVDDERLLHATARKGPKTDDPVGSSVILFQRDGSPLAQAKLDRYIWPMCSDEQGRVYLLETEPFPRIVRYEISIEDRR